MVFSHTTIFEMNTDKIKLKIGNRKISVFEPVGVKKSVLKPKIKSITENLDHLTIRSAKSEAYEHFDEFFFK